MVFPSSKGMQAKNILISRDGKTVATGTHLLLDTRYLTSPPEYDLALVETDTLFSFGADLFGQLPEDGRWTAYGLQDVGLDGTRLTRDGTLPSPCEVFSCSEEPELSRHPDRVQLTEQALTECGGPIRTISARTEDAFTIACGFIPGASGGPVVASDDEGRVVLLGVISTHTHDYQSNGIAPAVRIEDLLEGHSYVLRIALRPESRVAPSRQGIQMDSAERANRHRVEQRRLEDLRAG